MELDISDRRELTLFIASVAVLMLASSVGFQALSTNPLEPETTLSASDAPDRYELNRSGTVDMVAISHSGGEPVVVRSLEVVLGTRSGGIVLNHSTNWTVNTTEFTFSLLSDGSLVGKNQSFREDDVLTISKVNGAVPRDNVYEFEINIQVIHLPSRTHLVEKEVRVR